MTAARRELGGSPEFDYVNLNDRVPSRFTTLAQALHPGVRSVAAQIAPYADEWRARNRVALQSDAPLWVVLGDSLSQGIGASRFANGWVPRCSAALAAGGVGHRVVNFSFSGARIGDVIERQLPAMARWRLQPDLTTVLVGSNDIVRPRLRRQLQERFADLLACLPQGALVASMPRAGGPLGTLDALIAAADPARRYVDVPVVLAGHRRAEDSWHPGDDAYAALAEIFYTAISTRGAAVIRPRPAG